MTINVWAAFNRGPCGAVAWIGGRWERKVRKKSPTLHDHTKNKAYVKSIYLFEL